MTIKEKPPMFKPKNRKAVTLLPRTARSLLLEQYRARQGNLTQRDESEPPGTETEYADRQFRQTAQGAAQSAKKAVRGQLQKGGGRFRQAIFKRTERVTSRQAVGKSTRSVSLSAKATAKRAVKQMQKKAAATAAKKAAVSTAKATVKTGKAAARIAQAVGRAAVALVKGLIALLSALPVVAAVILVIVLVVAAVCLFAFDTSQEEAGVPAVVEQINAELDERIDAICAEQESGAACRVEHTGPEDYWTETLAAYAAEHPYDYERFTMTPERAERLAAAFWDMTDLTASMQQGEQGPVCVVTVHRSTANELADKRGYTAEQRQYIAALLDEYRGNLQGLLPPTESGTTDSTLLN